MQQGDLDGARQQLSGLSHPRAFHLLGLVERRAGNLARAADLLEQAARAGGHDHELAHHRGLVARQMGDLEMAARRFREALKLDPGFAPALLSMGRLALDREDFRAARGYFERHAARAGQTLQSRYGLAQALLGLGFAERAESMFDALIGGGEDRPEIRFMRARARLELGELQAGVADLEASFRARPTALTLRLLASQYWMLGRDDDFLALIDEAAGHPDLIVQGAELLRQSGAAERSLALLAPMGDRLLRDPVAAAIKGWAQIDLGAGAEAERTAVAAMGKSREHRALASTLIVALLMQDRADEALQQVRRMREAEPLGQHWIAYEATALRLLGDSGYRELFDPDVHVQTYLLPTPAGFSDLEAFNIAFRDLVGEYHRYPRAPLDQSLRGGSQTYRNLATLDHPTARAYLDALREPVRDFLAHLQRRAAGPTSARITGEFTIDDCWSVMLGKGGYHVDHVHPKGWISSAYYVEVPCGSDGTGAGGRIRFGHPPFDTASPLEPERWIEPSAGMVVLFPSYAWHGTEPVTLDGTRVTAPFDVIPV